MTHDTWNAAHWRDDIRRTGSNTRRSAAQRDHGANQPPVYTAEQVSQGYTVLNTPLRKFIFLAGLAGAVLLGAILSVPHGWF